MKLVASDTVQGGQGFDELMNLADTMASSAATLNQSQQSYDSFVKARNQLQDRLKYFFEA